MEVIEKYEALMVSTLGDESLYTRAKETLFHQFEQLQLTEKEKAGLTAEFVTKFSLGMSQASMQTALSWSKEERDGPYQLALVKANTENALAGYEKIKEEICLLQKEDELKCVTIEATMAASLRENGRVKTYDADEPCKPIAMEDEGLKYFQTKQVQADSQRIFSDTYRKSGVVQLGIDPDDAVFKGLTGNTHNEDGELAGYTAQQTANAERTRIAFEDSKVNHAANSSASMIGQMLSAEVAPADADVQRWRDAVDRLLDTYHTTPTA
ncbi:hypothetical protein DRO03_08900 [Methanosarcinales archaeon]|nr:MAG: hypothetical protein DRO03_08900 [Methanosarcinales archaeon]